MNWYIHHVNIQAYDVPEAAAFYRDVIGLKEAVWSYPDGYSGDTGPKPDTRAAFGSQNRGIHLVRGRPEFQGANKLHLNPTIGGHFALTVPDVAVVKARLEAAGHIVSDAGVYAMAGMWQIYVYDPFQNVIEINQAVDGSAGPAPAEGEAHGVRMEPGDWSLHHVNLPVHRVREAAAWFRDMIGLDEGDWAAAEGSPVADYVADPDRLAVLGDENRGLHLVKPSPEFAKRNGFHHNPTIGGHFAVNVPDLEPIRARLEAANILYTDAGSYAMAGLRQLYVYDPSMNLVELNQSI